MTQRLSESRRSRPENFSSPPRFSKDIYHGTNGGLLTTNGHYISYSKLAKCHPPMPTGRKLVKGRILGLAKIEQQARDQTWHVPAVGFEKSDAALQIRELPASIANKIKSCVRYCPASRKGKSSWYSFTITSLTFSVPRGNMSGAVPLPQISWCKTT